MRTIKFRGKRVDNGEWVYGSYIKFSNGKTEIHTTFEDGMKTGIITSGLNEIIPKTVCQFTGLFDINGKEIYEGDIVYKDEDEVWSVEYDESEAKFIVCNQLNSDRPFQSEYTAIDCLKSDESKVVSLVKVVVYKGKEFYAEVNGNIHDNPELVK